MAGNSPFGAPLFLLPVHSTPVWPASPRPSPYLYTPVIVFSRKFARVICIGVSGRPVGHVDSIINTRGYSLVARTCRCIKYERKLPVCARWRSYWWYRCMCVHSGGDGGGGGGGGCRLHTKCILLKRTFQNVVMNKPSWTQLGREATRVCGPAGIGGWGEETSFENRVV